jgi:hypothetical protein
MVRYGTRSRTGIGRRSHPISGFPPIDSTRFQQEQDCRFVEQEPAVKHLALIAVAVAGSMCAASFAAAAKAPPAEWDGLVKIKAKRLDLVYLQPGADFRGYTKVMLSPTEVAFEKNWQRDYNSSSSSLASRISDREMEEALGKGVVEAGDIFAAAWTKSGYTVVTEPGPDVMRVKTGIVNIRVTAPDQQTAGRSYTFAGEAGYATLFVEARDSLTGALLGRAVDQGIAGDNMNAWRTRSSNRSDFRQLVSEWADVSVRGMDELKSLSPIQP